MCILSVNMVYLAIKETPSLLKSEEGKKDGIFAVKRSKLRIYNLQKSPIWENMP